MELHVTSIARWVSRGIHSFVEDLSGQGLSSPTIRPTCIRSPLRQNSALPRSFVQACSTPYRLTK
jgi:hypothetical protein